MRGNHTWYTKVLEEEDKTIDVKIEAWDITDEEEELVKEIVVNAFNQLENLFNTEKSDHTLQ